MSNKLTIEELNILTKKALAHKRLIAEVFSEEIETEIEQEVINYLKKYSLVQLIQSYPFVFIRNICWVALQYYDQDSKAFWDNYLKHLGLNKCDIDTNVVGHSFEEILRGNKPLELFKDIPKASWRYVNKIILHGGLPRKRLKVYFDALYDSFLSEKYSLSELLENYLITTIIRKFFLLAGQYAITFYNQTWKLLQGINKNNINLPKFVIEEYDLWKNEQSEKNEFIQNKLKRVRNERIFFSVLADEKLAVIMEGLRVSRDSEVRLFLQIGDQKRHFNVDLQAILEEECVLQTTILVLTEDEVKRLMNGDLLRVYDANTNELLGFKSLFPRDFQVLLFENINDQFKSIDKVSIRKASLLLIPKTYSISIINNDTVQVLHGKYYTLIHSSDIQDLLNVKIIDENNKPVLLEDVDQGLTIAKPLENILYNSSYVYSGVSIDAVFDLNVYQVEINNELESEQGSRYGEYIYNSIDVFLFIPEISISLNTNTRQLILTSKSIHLLFVNKLTEITIQYAQHDEEIAIDIYLDDKKYLVKYYLPAIYWDIRSNKLALNINNKKMIIFRKECVLNKYLIIKTKNSVTLDKIFINKIPINLLKAQDNVFLLSMNQLMTTIENSTTPSIYLYLYLNNTPTPLVKIQKTINISDIKCIEKDGMLNLSWEETGSAINIDPERSLLVWDYNKPWLPSIEYALSGKRNISIPLPAHGNILVQWLIKDSEDDVVNILKIDLPQKVMPIYHIEELTMLPAIIRNKFEYSIMTHSYIKKDVLSTKEMEVIEAMQAFSVSPGIYLNYIIYEKADSPCYKEKELKDLIRQSEYSKSLPLMNVMRFALANNITYLINYLMKEIRFINLDIYMYDMLRLDYSEKLKELIDLDNYKNVYNRILSQSIPASARCIYFVKYYIDRFYVNPDAKEYFLANTIELNLDDEYNHLIKYILENKEHILPGDVKREITFRRSLYDHPYRSVEDYRHFIENIGLLSDSAYIDALVTNSIVCFNKNIHKHKDYLKLIKDHELEYIDNILDRIYKIRTMRPDTEKAIYEFLANIESLKPVNDSEFYIILERLIQAPNAFCIKDILRSVSINNVQHILMILLYLSEKDLLWKKSDFRLIVASRDPLVRTYYEFFADKRDREVLFRRQINSFALIYLKLLAKQLSNILYKHKDIILRLNILNDDKISTLLGINEKIERM